MRRAVLGALLAAALLAASPAGAQSAGRPRAGSSALTLDVGVIAASVAGGGTLGGSWQVPVVRGGRWSFELRLAAHATGLRSGALGALVLAHGAAAYDARPAAPLLVNLGAGVDGLTLRACGAVNCGRLTGVVPAASARVVYVCAACWEGAVGLALTAGWRSAHSPRVQAGSMWSFTAGPYWRLGGKD